MYNNLNRSDVRDKPFSANFDQIYSYLNYTSNNVYKINLSNNSVCNSD